MTRDQFIARWGSEYIGTSGPLPLHQALVDDLNAVVTQESVLAIGRVRAQSRAYVNEVHLDFEALADLTDRLIKELDEARAELAALRAKS